MKPSRLVKILSIVLCSISIQESIQASYAPVAHARTSHSISAQPKQQTLHSSEEISKIIRVFLMQLLAQPYKQKNDNEIRSELSDMVELLKDLEPREILGLVDVTPETTERNFKIFMKKLYILVAGDYKRFPEAKELRNQFISAYNQLQSSFTYMAVALQNTRQVAPRPFLGDPKLLAPRI